MAKFKKIDTINIIRRTGIVPVFYNKDVEITKKVVKAGQTLKLKEAPGGGFAISLIAK